jgi:apoptosis-inducing factor 2
MGQCQSYDSNVKVLILGGGYAGIMIAKELDKIVHVTLVSENDHFLHNVAMVRGITDANFAKTLSFPYKSLLKNGTFLQGRITKVEPTQVKVQAADGSNKTLTDFNYLVVALGSSYGKPMKGALSKAEFDSIVANSSSAIKTASKVVIVGGGATGVEVAAELRQFPNIKDITLITSGTRLLEAKNFPEKNSAEIAKKLDKLRIKVVYNQRVDVPSSLAPGQVVVTTPTIIKSANHAFESDVSFFFLGGSSNASPLQEGFGAYLDQSKKYIRVTKTLQVDGLSNVFAAGDIAGTTEAKQVFVASMHAAHIVKSIKLALKGKPAPLYKEAPTAVFLALGKNDGYAYLNGSVLPSWLITSLKSKALFVPKYAAMFK